jgi:hypothetical protein
MTKKGVLEPLALVQEEVTQQPCFLEASPSCYFNDDATVELINKWNALDDEVKEEYPETTQDDLQWFQENRKQEFLDRYVSGADKDDFVEKAELYRKKINKTQRKCPRPIRFEGVDSHRSIISNDVGTDPMPYSVSVQCDIMPDNDKVPEIADDIHTIHKRSMFRKVRDQKFLKFHTRLTYYLRHKYFMKTRDRGLINMMANDARIWMLKEKFKCESNDDFLLMTQSICAAFVVNDQELIFRQILKNKTTHDNMKHLNDTLAGNLGRTGLKLEASDIKSACSSLFCSDLHMPVASMQA